MSKGIFAVAAHQFRRLYSKLFIEPCFLCGQVTTGTPVCFDCAHDLPKLPHHCERCALPLSPPAKICGRCLSKPPVFDATYAAYLYESPIDKCIMAFKFHQQLGFTTFFANALYEQHRHRPDLPDYLMPIPLHAHRLRWRGYNQSAEITRLLAQQLNCPYDLYRLKRIKPTLPQSKLPFKARKTNLHQAFSYQSDAPPASVALIDDVMTTGQTVSEASRCLKKQGVKRIEIWTIARAIRHY